MFDGLIDGWMDGWMDSWMDGYISQVALDVTCLCFQHLLMLGDACWVGGYVGRGFFLSMGKSVYIYLSIYPSTINELL